ncbi:hypothetical protein E1B28_002317 [Marasmius oreades]|uniref:C2 domain-containing protein n=1 Tax=Marasmius oreades TaxID=181124 RepID=A0A9P7UKG9_9AGAR|nr:uncharacterized protein E1B28_002317 [Marasmius oreades]KAG7086357.1 hypothetical protein E1B28_002317 [Marasmius oreades]
MSHILERVGETLHNAKSNARDMASVSKSLAGEKLLNVPYVDLTIQFIGASGLPKMDVVGSADPYFVAKLDNRISFVSTVKVNTLTPVWNEIWRVKNVPSTVDLSVEVLDKDLGTPHDDYIGKFKCSVAPGAKEVELEGPLLRRNNRGTFWLKIDAQRSNDKQYPFLFDGPIRYSRHSSPTVGLFTNSEGKNGRLYSTWKMYIVGVRVHFQDHLQPWNRKYKAAQSIFQGPASIAVRSPIQAGHRMLYARSTYNGFGLIEKREDFMELLHSEIARIPWHETELTKEETRLARSSSPGPFAKRVKPAVYTYIISAEDESFRFSETGAAFFVDFASKHALHANCAEAVRYSGEFHPRPKGGWGAFSDAIPDEEVEWELVFDNNSGTYAPDKDLLPNLKALFEQNFPGFNIFALDRDDEELTQSREACRDYALRCRGVKNEELQPHAGAGEVTLISHASAKAMHIRPKLEGEKEM